MSMNIAGPRPAFGSAPANVASTAAARKSAQVTTGSAAKSVLIPAAIGATVFAAPVAAAFALFDGLATSAASVMSDAFHAVLGHKAAVTGAEGVLAAAKTDVAATTKAHIAAHKAASASGEALNGAYESLTGASKGEALGAAKGYIAQDKATQAAELAHSKAKLGADAAKIAQQQAGMQLDTAKILSSEANALEKVVVTPRAAAVATTSGAGAVGGIAGSLKGVRDFFNKALRRIA